MPPNTPSPPARGPTLNASRHNQPPTDQDYKGLIDRLIALAPDHSKAEARALGTKLLETHRSHTQPRTNLALLVKDAVAEGVKEALKPTTQPTSQPTTRTWATIAAALPNHTVPKKVIPARQNQEVLIRGSKMATEHKTRTPQETVQAINQASSRQGAVAARQLPSGDVIVTFKDSATKQWYSTNKQWLQEAFGQEATEAQRTYAILVKGLRKTSLQGTPEEDFGKELGLKTVEKVKYRLPHNPQFTRATVMVSLTDLDEARRACDSGVVWRAQILECEPYWAPLAPVQCYKCFEWGHLQRYCRKPAKCPRCAVGAHGEGGKPGEAQCPTHTGQVPHKCPACGGKHTAWAKECPKAAQAKQRARDAYQHRPRTFESATTAKPLFGPPTQFTQPAQAPLEDTEDFQVVGSRKRRRGKPPTSEVLQRAGQHPSQARLAFSKEAQQAFQITQSTQASQAVQTPQSTQGTQPLPTVPGNQPAEDVTMGLSCQ